jgi:hypothetical protein
LAAVVSLTVVPRLFHRAAANGCGSPSRLHAKGGSSPLLIVAIAAFNTGNNLIFIILSAALALLAVSECL